MTRTLRLTEAARNDIAAILRASAEAFGSRARERYAALVATGLADLRRDPAALGSADRSELGTGIRTYHLRHCRKRAGVDGTVVGSPRHLIAYRIDGPDRVVVVRVLHDAMELAAHVVTENEGRESSE